MCLRLLHCTISQSSVYVLYRRIHLHISDSENKKLRKAVMICPKCKNIVYICFTGLITNLVDINRR